MGTMPSTETSIARITRTASHVVETRFKPGAMVGEAGLRENIRERRSLCGEVPHVMLAVVPEGTAFSAEIMGTDAFHYDGPRADLRAIAVVADGPMTQMIMKLYFGCFPQVSRTRLFTRKSEAKDWLRSQLLESGFTEN